MSPQVTKVVFYVLLVIGGALLIVSAFVPVLLPVGTGFIAAAAAVGQHETDPPAVHEQAVQVHVQEEGRPDVIVSFSPAVTNKPVVILGDEHDKELFEHKLRHRRHSQPS